MKKVLLLTCIFSISLIIACQDLEFTPESELIDLQKNSDDNRSPNLIDHQINLDFREDYKISKPIRVQGTPPSYLIFKYKSIPYLSYEELKREYPNIKNDIITLSNEDKIQLESDGIQDVGLRILRRHLIDEDDDFSNQESIYLLDVLVQSGAIDLDVLVDTFIKIREVLPEEEENNYLNYLQNLYREGIDNLNEDWQNMRDKYVKAEDPKEKKKYLMFGKNLERLSKSLNYSKNILPEILND